MASCRLCCGDINPDAVKCRHCGEWIDPNHFISLLSSSNSFQTIQDALTSNITHTINSKIKSTITVALPVVLFLMGGAGVLLVKAAISDSIIAMKKAEFVIDNADDAVKQALDAKETLEYLEDKKKEAEDQLNSLRSNISQLRDQTAEIGKARSQEAKKLNEEIKEIKIFINDLESELSKQKGQYAPIANRFEVDKDEDPLEDFISKRIEYVKYQVLIGSYPGVDIPVKGVVNDLVSDGFTALEHQFLNLPESDERYTSVVIGNNLPNAFVLDLLKKLSPYKDNFDYIRFNVTKSQDNGVFIGANSKSSSEENDKKLDNYFWSKVSQDDYDIKGLIRSYSNSVE